MYICDFHIYLWSITQKYMLFCFVFCHSVQEQIGNHWFRVFTRSYLSSLLNIYLWVCSIHTAHEEGNSSGLPHFDLTTTDGSDCSSLRHVAWFVVLSTLVEERLPHCTLACLFLECIPSFSYVYCFSYISIYLPLPSFISL